MADYSGEYKSKKKWWSDNQGKASLGEIVSFGLAPNKPDMGEYAFNRRKAFEDMAGQYTGEAMQGASAIGQLTGQGMNRRGLGDSPLGAGITAGTQNQAIQRAIGELNRMRSQMEGEISERGLQQKMMEYQMEMQMLSDFIGLFSTATGSYLGYQGTPTGQLTPPSGALPSQGGGAPLPAGSDWSTWASQSRYDR